MRKLLAILMAALLLIAPALAEAPAENVQTRTSVFEIEGMAEEVVETLYQAEKYSLWYPAGMLKPTDYYSNISFVPVDETVTNVSFLVVPTEVPAEEAEAFIAEATGGYGPEWTISDVREMATENENVVLTVEAAYEGEIHRYYLVQGFDGCLCITAMFPLEAAEGYGVRFDALVKTIGF